MLHFVVRQQAPRAFKVFDWIARGVSGFWIKGKTKEKIMFVVVKTQGNGIFTEFYFNWNLISYGPFFYFVNDYTSNSGRRPDTWATACNIKLYQHQYIFLGNSWLRRYFFQRLLAWAAFTLRRVVGLTKVSRSRNSNSRPDSAIFFLNFLRACSTLSSCTNTVLPYNFNIIPLLMLRDYLPGFRQYLHI